MKKFFIAIVALGAMALTGCAATEEAAPVATTTETTETTSAENVDYPAQADMTRLGPRAETIVPFQDNQGRYWLCDQSNPTGEGNEYFYTNPNGCDGPYDSEQALIDDTFNLDNIVDDIFNSQEPEPEPEPEPVYVEPTTATAVEPYVVECSAGTPGPALMSDGTMQHSDYCFEVMGGEAYLAEESWANSPNNPALAEHYAEQAAANN